MTDKKPQGTFIVGDETDKSFDPFEHCDDAWTKAVYEVGKTLPSWKANTIPLISPSASSNRMKTLISNLKMNALAGKLREAAKK